VAIFNVQVLEVVRHIEEHVLLLVQILEPGRVVGEPVAAVGRRRVAQEDALHLAREVGCHGGVVAHDVAVGGVCHEDEFAVGEGFEDFVEQILADAEGGGDVAEVEVARVEGAAGVGAVDELFVVAAGLFRGRGEVMEVELQKGTC